MSDKDPILYNFFYLNLASIFRKQIREHTIEIYSTQVKISKRKKVSRSVQRDRYDR